MATDPDFRPPEAYSFERWQRIGLTVTGASGAAAGAIAVFTNDNGTGAAALIVTGTLLAVLGIVGRLQSLKLGDAEASFGQRIVDHAREAISTAAADQESEAEKLEDAGDVDAAAVLRSSAAELQETAEALAAPPLLRFGPVPVPSAGLSMSRQEALAFEHDIAFAIRAVVNTHPLLSLGDQPPGERWDSYITHPNGAIAVDASYLSPTLAGRPSPWLENTVSRRFFRASTSSARTGLLVVVPSHVDADRFGRFVKRLPAGVAIVRWSGSESLEQLDEAVERLSSWLVAVAPGSP